MGRKREAGVALVTALLVVALATAAAVAMVGRQQLDIRRTANVLDWDQGYLYVLGLEDFAGQVLREDRQKNKVDNFEDDWADENGLTVPYEGALLHGTIKDMQGLFNLNNLVQKGISSTLDIDRFRRLLTALDLDPELATAVVDWLDPDVNVGFPGGAEDGEYLRHEPPYRAANRPMASPTELRLVEGFKKEDYEKLAPYVTALPTATALNVNTVSAGLPELVMALAPGITRQDAEALLQNRGKEGFSSVSKFLQDKALAGRNVDPTGLSVASDYFMVNMSVELDRASLHFRSLLVRDADGNTRTVRREQGVY